MLIVIITLFCSGAMRSENTVQICGPGLKTCINGPMGKEASQRGPGSDLIAIFSIDAAKTVCKYPMGIGIAA